MHSIPIKVHYVYGGNNKITRNEYASIPVTLTANYPILVKKRPSLKINGNATATTSTVSDEGLSQWIDVVTVPSKTTVVISGKDIITSVENPLVDNKSLHFFPNPAHNFVNIYADVNLQQIGIYTIDGVLIKYEYTDSTNAKVDVSNIPSGTYILRAANQSALLIKK